MNRSGRLLAMLLAAAVALGLCWPWDQPQAAMAVSQSEIDEMKEEREGIDQRIDELQSQLEALSADKSAALERKALLDQQMEAIQEQIDTTAALIAALDDQIAGKEAEIARLEAQEAEQYDLFCRRVRAMEETGSVSYLAILFNASSFEEFLDQAMLVTEIMDYDNAIIDALQATRQQLESAKAELETARSDQQAVQAQQESARGELQAKVDEASALVAEIEASQAEYEATIQSLEEEMEAIDDEIAAKQEELNQQIAQGEISIDTGTGYYWPVPGYNKITSMFGWRNHPIYHTWKYHNGCDVGGIPVGTPIGAAQGGVVITATYSSSYGYYVVISHGNNNSTLYAHMNSMPPVSVGQVVTQGQTVGYVGASGNVTGPHLHYEMRVGGTRVDPLAYYPSMSFNIVC